MQPKVYANYMCNTHYNSDLIYHQPHLIHCNTNVILFRDVTFIKTSSCSIVYLIIHHAMPPPVIISATHDRSTYVR